MQVRYEDMLAHPKKTISSILEFIGLDVSDDYLRQLQSLGLRAATQSWRTSMTRAEISAVETIGHSRLERLFYA